MWSKLHKSYYQAEPDNNSGAKNLFNSNPSPEFLSFAQAQLEILPSPTKGRGEVGVGWEKRERSHRNRKIIVGFHPTYIFIFSPHSPVSLLSNHSNSFRLSCLLVFYKSIYVLHILISIFPTHSD